MTEREKAEKELKKKSNEIRSYARQIRRAYQALERAYLEMIHALVISVETRDPYTRGHPEMLTFSEYFKEVIPIVRHHHERWDGKGYPDGLKGEEIPLGARILAVADTFDAMSSSRPYRDPVDLKKIIDELKDNAGTQFDPQIVEIWLEIMEKYRISKPEPTYKQKSPSGTYLKTSTIEARKRLLHNKKSSFKSVT